MKMIPLEYNVSIVSPSPNLTVFDLDFDEVFFLGNSTDGGIQLDGTDIFLVVLLLFGVLCAGALASFQGHAMQYLPNCLTFRFALDDDQDDTLEDDAVTKSASEYSGNAPGKVALTLEASSTRRNPNEASEFFLADRNMSFWFVGASLFASNIGSEHFVGQTGDGARRGMPVAMYEWYAAILLLMLGWIFGPVYRRSGVYTTPEFMEKRFGPGARRVLTLVTLIMYVMAKLSASIYGGSLVLSVALGWGIYFSAGVCIFLSTIYTISGGLRAVMYTDLIQAVVFVLGGFIVMSITLNAVGGYEGLQKRLLAQNKAEFWKLWRPASDPEYSYTGMMLGQPITSIWYWCMDQDLVQRVLSARNDTHSKAGCTFAAVLKILPPFIMIIPGIAASTLFAFRYTKDESYDVEFEGYANTDTAYPVILTQLMPSGIRGIMVASIMTAMMSSLDSVFNAGATIVANDIYKVARPNATNTELARVGRLATLALAILAFLWIPVIEHASSLFSVVVEINGYLGPSIGIMICVAVMWPRANANGAVYAMVVGFTLGAIRLITNVALKDVVDPASLGFFFAMPFLSFSILIWTITLAVCVGVSLATEPPPEEVERYVVRWQDIFKVHDDSLHYESWVRHLVDGSAVAVMLATLIIWVIFS